MPNFVKSLIGGFLGLTLILTLIFIFVPGAADAAVEYINACRILGHNIATPGNQPGIG